MFGSLRAMLQENDTHATVACCACVWVAAGVVYLHEMRSLLLSSHTRRKSKFTADPVRALECGERICARFLSVR